MRINGINNSIYHKTDAETAVSKATDNYQSAYKAASRVDCVEISSSAYEAYAENEEMTATSGKDSLGITKGSKEHSFVIHFSDSAMVSRAISRGYITVNGTKIELTDDAKKQLTKIDQKAQVDRERAFQAYTMQHEMAVAKQQGEAYKNMAEGISRAYQIADKIAKGGKISPSEAQELMEFNPQLYVMSKNAALMAKQKEKQVVEPVKELEPKQESDQAEQNADESSFEWKSYEARLSVSLSDTPQIQGVSEGEIVIET